MLIIHIQLQKVLQNIFYNLSYQVQNKNAALLSYEKKMNLVLASCWETSRRVLICSETTPTARKATQARPAPSPNLLVNDVATQSVESTLLDDDDDVTGLIGLCFSALRELPTDSPSEVSMLSCEANFWGWDSGEEEDGGGGDGDEEEMWWVLVVGRENMGGETKKEAMFKIFILKELRYKSGGRKYLEAMFAYWFSFVFVPTLSVFEAIPFIACNYKNG